MTAVREGQPTSDGDNWENLELVSINVDDDDLISGDGDGVVATDEVLAYNGDVVVREGDVVDGVTLTAFASLRFVTLTDSDQAAYGWGYSRANGTRETVFFACDANDFAGSSQVLLTTVDDGIDTDDDGVPDYQITGLETPSPRTVASRATGDGRHVYLPLALDDGDTTAVAMVEVPVSCCGNEAVNPFETCDDNNDDDTDDCVSTCAAAGGGGGFVQAGVEECDDANDVDTDECLADCSLPGATSTGSEGGANLAGADTPAGDNSAGMDGTDTDTDTGDSTGAGGSGIDDDGGCACTTDDRRDGRGAFLIVAVALGWTRRRHGVA